MSCLEWLSLGADTHVSEDLLVNEIAPRPHNSGHYTIEACPISQYEAHIRAILELPLPGESTKLITPNTNALMLNILGGKHPMAHITLTEKALAIPGARIHLYGKGGARPGRKMGHITLVTDSMEEAESRMRPLVKAADLIRASRLNNQPEPTPKTPPKSDTQNRSRNSIKAKSPLIAVTMGSKSDSSVLAPGIKLLEEFEIPYSVTITSAHRTPEKMVRFAQEAALKGIKVIIAAAGNQIFILQKNWQG